MQNSVNAVSVLLRTARLNAGISLAEVAEGICSESYLSLIESGKRLPGKKIRDQLLARLQVPINSGFEDSLSLDFRVAEMSLKIGDMAAAEKAKLTVDDQIERTFIEALKSEMQGDLALSLELLTGLSGLTARGLLQTKISLALTRVSRDIGFTEQAIACGEEELARERDEFSDEAESALLELRAVLSGCYLVKGNVPRALAIANQIEAPAGDSWEQVISLWAKASAMEANGDFSGALENSNKASIICRRIERPIAEARLNLTALECRIQLGQIESKTFVDLENLFAFFESKGLKFDKAEALLIKSKAYSLVAKFEEAEDTLNEALTYLGSDHSGLKIRIQIALSKTGLSNNSPRKARQYAYTARTELESYLNSSPTMAASWREIGEIYSQLGEMQMAYECLLRATEVLGLKGEGGLKKMAHGTYS